MQSVWFVLEIVLKAMGLPAILHIVFHKQIISSKVHHKGVEKMNHEHNMAFLLGFIQNSNISYFELMSMRGRIYIYIYLYLYALRNSGNNLYISHNSMYESS